ncbi:MAG: FecR domain-containing protein [Deltaproteobacteria bacterium]|nr:FecR domain-containing protein [Deltaproteobacteria bacterium]MBN2670162.1 FecR domain-containing protein [Deltaproteobacteria bacterium]
MSKYSNTSSDTSTDNAVNDKLVDAALEKLPKSASQISLHGGDNDISRLNTINKALSKYHLNQSHRPHRPYRRHVPIVAAAAAIITSVTVASVWWSSKTAPSSSTQGDDRAPLTNIPIPTEDKPFSPTTVSQLIPHSRFTLLHGNVRCNNNGVQLGSKVPSNQWIETGEGEINFQLPSGIAVGLTEHSAVSVLWESRRGFYISLNSGQALFSVDPNDNRDRLVVDTPRGVIHVSGTLFSVRVENSGDTSVHLHKGQIHIECSLGTPLDLLPGQTVHLESGKHSVSAIPQKGDSPILMQLRKIGCIDEGTVFTELDPGGCDAPITPGDSNVDKEKTASPNHRKGAGSPMGGAQVVKRLLLEARDAQRERRFKDAATALRKLIAAYPGNKESHTAMVTLGRLELKHFGNPSGAMQYFSAYLNKNGPLNQEALHGKASAERELGLTIQEKKTLLRLVSQYPEGVAADAARKRLRQLSADPR